MIDCANFDSQIEDVIPHLVDEGLSILQYAKDTILFMEHGIKNERNLKLIMSEFEKLSCLKINFHKSGLFYFGEAKDDVNLYAELFGCRQSWYYNKYLGILIHYRRLTNVEWKLVERLQIRFTSWKGKRLFFGVRMVLINSVVSNLALYMISFFQLLKGVLIKVLIKVLFAWR
jgi:hypothetical protein